MEAEFEYVVQPADVEASAPSGRWWITVAARALPLVATTSKAKRERKATRLRLNGDATLATNTVVKVGDRITYAPPRPLTCASGVGDDKSALSPSRWLDVCRRQGMRLVFEGEAFAVIVKPAGVHVKGRGRRTVEFALPALLQRRSQTSDALVIPHAVHRLDYRVGGLLAVAKTRSAETSLAAQFENHRVTKKYRAILVGRLDPAVNSGLQSLAPDGLLDVAPHVQIDSEHLYAIEHPVEEKRSITVIAIRQVTPSARYEWITTVDLWPLTGRWHQLRLHMTSIGHPIVGDDLHHDYVTSRFDNLRPEVVRGVGLFLHAVEIRFDDGRGNSRSFAIDEPQKFARFRHFCAMNHRKQIEHDRHALNDAMTPTSLA